MGEVFKGALLAFCAISCCGAFFVAARFVHPTFFYATRVTSCAQKRIVKPSKKVGVFGLREYAEDFCAPIDNLSLLSSIAYFQFSIE